MLLQVKGKTDILTDILQKNKQEHEYKIHREETMANGHFFLMFNLISNQKMKLKQDVVICQ